MILKKNPNIVQMFNEEEKEYILFDTVKSKIKMLNVTGAYIWTKLPISGEFDSDDYLVELTNALRNVNNNTIEIITDIKEYVNAMIKEGVLIVQSI